MICHSHYCMSSGEINTAIQGQRMLPSQDVPYYCLIQEIHHYHQMNHQYSHYQQKQSFVIVDNLMARRKINFRNKNR